MAAPIAPAFALEGLSIEEGSFVDDGDNPEAHIKLFKSKDASSMLTAAPFTIEIVKSLPDTAFLLVKGGARILPVRGPDGAVDVAALAHAFKTIPTLAEADRPAAKAAADAALEQATKDCYGVPRTTATIIAERKFRDEFWTLKWAFSDSVSSILGAMDSLLGKGQLGKLLAQTTSEFESAIGELVAGIAKVAPALALEVISLVEATKAACDVEGAAVADAITKALSDLDQVAPQEKKNMTTANKNAPAPAPVAKSLEDILAGLPEDQRATVKATLEAAEKAKTDAENAAKAAAATDAEKARAALEKQVADSAAEIAKLKEEKLDAEFLAKARTIGAGDVNDVSKLLKAAYGVSKENGELLEKNLRAMAAQARAGTKSITKSVGSEGEGLDAGDDPDAKLEAAAKELQKADPKLSYHKAYSMALENNKHLYDESVAKQSKRAQGDNPDA